MRHSTTRPTGWRLPTRRSRWSTPTPTPTPRWSSAREEQTDVSRLRRTWQARRSDSPNRCALATDGPHVICVRTVHRCGHCSYRTEWLGQIDGAGRAAGELVGLDEGAIIVDNTVLSQADRAACQSQIAWLPQHPAMVPGTVAENLAPYGPLIPMRLRLLLPLPGGTAPDTRRAAPAVGTDTDAGPRRPGRAPDERRPTRRGSRVRVIAAVVARASGRCDGDRRRAPHRMARRCRPDHRPG